MVGGLVENENIRLRLEERLYGSPFHLSTGARITLVGGNALGQIADTKTGAQYHLPFVGSVHAGKDIEQRGLTGTVLCHKSHTLPLRNGEGQAPEKKPVANALGETLRNKTYRFRP